MDGFDPTLSNSNSNSPPRAPRGANSPSKVPWGGNTVIFMYFTTFSQNCNPVEFSW